MSNVEILGQPKYRPIKSRFQGEPVHFYQSLQREVITGKPRNFTDFEDLIYERDVLAYDPQNCEAACDPDQ